MRFGPVRGVDIRDDSLATAEGGVGLWKAGAALTVGDTVIIDTAVNTGKQVVTLTASGTAHDEHLIVGAYSSVSGQATGGTGAQTTTTGFSGRAARTGDFVEIATGPVKARVDGTTDVAAKDRLQAFTTAGALQKDAALASFPKWPVVALEASTANSINATMIYVFGGM